MSLHVCQDPWDVQHQVNASVNYGLWAILMHQHLCIDCNECSAHMGLSSGEGYACAGAEGTWKLCIFHSVFP